MALADDLVQAQVWHTTGRWRSAHLLIEAVTAAGAAITLCGRQSCPDDAWTEDREIGVEFQCGQCSRRLADTVERGEKS